MSQPKKFYSQEFKIQALRMVDQGKDVTDVALHFGIDRCTLYRWHTKARAGKFPGFQPTRENAVDTQRKFPEEFKIEKVREIEKGKSISQVARRNRRPPHRDAGMVRQVSRLQPRPGSPGRS